MKEPTQEEIDNVQEFLKNHAEDRRKNQELQTKKRQDDIRDRLHGLIGHTIASVDVDFEKHHSTIEEMTINFNDDLSITYESGKYGADSTLSIKYKGDLIFYE